MLSALVVQRLHSIINFAIPAGVLQLSGKLPKAAALLQLHQNMQMEAMAALVEAEQHFTIRVLITALLGVKMAAEEAL